jgi:hypothetical protein
MRERPTYTKKRRMCVFVCVRQKERERERGERNIKSIIEHFVFAVNAAKLSKALSSEILTEHCTCLWQQIWLISPPIVTSSKEPR